MLWVFLLAIAGILVNTGLDAQDEVFVPVVDGPWWQVAGDPDLGEYTRDEQQPVDFGVWQAADGTWQLWSCIRHTACGGKTRLFYRWEGKQLTDNNWTPLGIAMEANPELGETVGGLQAPHVVRYQGLYHMAYGDWVNICFAISKDGKTFERVVQPNGKTGVFSEGPGANTRDAMLIQIDGLWHCYYTAVRSGRGYGFCRTSPDLKRWSPSAVVSYGGSIGPGPWNNECPHVVRIEPGVFYYFRNQYYGQRACNWVYRSDNPLNFGIDEESGLVRNWRVAAPEIILHEGQYYVASLMDSLKGIKIARLKWEKRPARGKAVFDFDSEAGRTAWKRVSGDLPATFTTSSRSNFSPPGKYFIGTAEVDGQRFDDSRQGIIEGPAFRLEKGGYSLYASGGRDRQRLFVAIVDEETGDELVRLTGERNNQMKKTRVDCKMWLGRKVFVRVVDSASTSWGHINFGGMFEDPLFYE
jgi:hypothetical protein